jgi:hypothetical protein
MNANTIRGTGSHGDGTGICLDLQIDRARYMQASVERADLLRKSQCARRQDDGGEGESARKHKTLLSCWLTRGAAKG